MKTENEVVKNWWESIGEELQTEYQRKYFLGAVLPLNFELICSIYRREVIERNVSETKNREISH